MTTKIYQAQLPLRNHRIVTPRPLPRPIPPPDLENSPGLADAMKQKFLQALYGYWYCTDCDAVCERVEGEQGQPAHCAACGSHHIFFNPPVVSQALQPEAA